MIQNRSIVKTLRVVFLVLLALLLPMRGAVAGAMLCPEGSSSPLPAQASKHIGHDTHHDTGAAHHHGHAGSTHHDEQAGHATACNICATFCSMTPMLSAMPTLVQAMLASTLTFPELSTPSPTFQSDGQERPPRSI